MSKIEFNYMGNDYTLEYTRRTVMQMEQNGFSISELGDRPMTHLPRLFAGAFLAHHPKLSRKVIDDIYDHMGNKRDLVQQLAEMYSAPIASLLDDPDDAEGGAGNVSWTVA